MESRVATVAIIVENMDSVEKLNAILHDYAAYMIGRMGIPYRQKNVNIISIAVDAQEDVISDLAVKFGLIDVIFVNTVFSNI